MFNEGLPKHIPKDFSRVPHSASSWLIVAVH